MNENELRGKIIKGLKCISGDVVWCAYCPYSSSDGSGRGERCKREAAKDALALLEALKPRVMTLREIDYVINTTSKENERIFWAEVRSRTRKSFGVFQLDIAADDNYEALLLGCSWPACYNRSTYGIKWRCWTSRPTDEQREATPW